MKRLVLALALALAACGPSAAQTEGWSPIELSATPLEMPERIGDLAVLAGFVLESPQARFGGLSGLHVFADGRLLAVADSGEWFLAELDRDPETGAPLGLRNARMALMRDESGQPFPTKEAGDAEDLAVLPDGRIAVSFEHTQSIRLYDLFGAGPMAPAAAGPPLAETARLGANRGLEALASIDEALIVGAERGHRAGPLPVWRVALGAELPVAPAYTLRAPFGYGLTAFAADEQRLWVVQRFFAPGLGLRVRLLEANLPDEPGPIAMTERAVVAAPNPVDNFEGIAVNNGLIYVISDDNFSEDQRTLLLIFAAPEAG
jgi:hypothetical protein